MSRTRSRHRRPAESRAGRYTSIKISTPVHGRFQLLGRSMGCGSMLDTYETVLRIAEKVKADPDLETRLVGEIDAERRARKAAEAVETAAGTA